MATWLFTSDWSSALRKSSPSANDGVRGADWRNKPLTSQCLETGERFRDRRKIREVRQALRRSDRNRLDCAGLNASCEPGIAFDDHADVSADDVVERVAGSAGIWNQKQFDPRSL